MADSDPISEASPSAKKRKLMNGSAARTWSSDNDSGDDLFDHETIATVPLARPLAGPQRQRSSQDARSREFSYITQPTQARTQFTNVSQSPSQDVQVHRSSPPVATPQRMAPPQPITKAPFSKPSGLLAGVASMAPRGTILRPPAARPKEPADIDSDMSDPPVEHSSDDEGRGLTSNIKPTQFTKGGHGIDSSPREVVRDSPQARAAEPPPSMFSKLVGQFKHQQSDDMTSSYGSSSRPPRPAPRINSAVMQPLSASPIQTLDDIEDFRLRNKIERMQAVLGANVPVARCYDALRRKHSNYEDALNFLVDEGAREADLTDDLAPSPFKQAQRAKGVAHSVISQQSSSQPVKASTKQNLKGPVQSISARYGMKAGGFSDNTTVPRNDVVQISSGSQEDVVRPEKRLLKNHRPRQPSPDYKASARRLVKKNIVADESDEEEAAHTPEPEVVTTSFDQRVLDFFNNSEIQDIIDLTDHAQEDVEFVAGQRPFRNLAQIRKIVRAASGPVKKGRGGGNRHKPIGERVLDTCEQMLAGYEAVDDLVNDCEKLAKPIKENLKAWGIGAAADGELRLMKLEELHDSGIGTPMSSNSDGSKKQKSIDFLKQPTNMGPDVVLKDYQLVGLNWLHMLYEARTSCILADDMGLGKTCQIIAFLAQLQLEAVDGVHLIIVPSSTLENWLREFERFAPSMKVIPYYGPHTERPYLQEQIEEERDSIDVIVTTYEMAKTDNKFMRRLGPAVCVYDEAHVLRNPKSDRYEKLMRIEADFKILLTGTPLQNNLLELVAILAFIMPILFNKQRARLDYIFQHRAKTNDSSHSALLSLQRTQRARSMVTPFILRRKKAQVLELPKKHSRVEYCELTDTQVEMYGVLQESVRKAFEEREAGIKKPRGVKRQHGNMLMDLRKAAIHPLLRRHLYNDKKIDKIVNTLMKDEEFAGNPKDMIVGYLTGDASRSGSLNGNDYCLHQFCAERPILEKYALHNQEWMDSGKVQKFKELVEQFAKNGDKVLVFSQFTMLMDILEQVLQTLEIKFMRLDGTTKVEVRQTMIDGFNTDEDITVFMLSTKAGGAGINLAGANKVIIFDSGFNPQDDIQAENRAHRVGQTRDVEVIRLISKDTIEEQIHALGVSKLALDERVAGEGATAAEDKMAEKAGQDAVEKMLMEKLRKQEDVKDTFKKGLESSGLQID
ncbi:hypothetical protein AMS68_001402 [Peltaster fructicola]|uniref:DNA helicase n=1 Tax=Peltaster fructicola TaxID=286661 RepID=A0A6H0XMM6_9PEZI|nr:hypothetical protein AMS68_001402 [Peltaster fructicola]